MIAPEVCNFPSPPCSFRFTEGFFEDNQELLLSCVQDHHYNHMVSATLPDTVIVPHAILDSLSKDCSYYKLSHVAAHEFTETAFIVSFIQQGQVTALSVNTNLDTDDCVCLTPSGHLVFSLNKVSFEELGLEGEPSFFCRRKPASRYVVTINLKADHFKPGKNNYERVQWCLKQAKNLKFDILVAWDPPDSDTCPSSIAAYFASRGVKVDLCEPCLEQRRDAGILVPHIRDCEHEELLEWLGAYNIQASLENSQSDSYVSTYQTPIPVTDEKRHRLPVAYLQCTGFFTAKQINNIFLKIREFIQGKTSSPWIGLHVHGFEDSPVKWGLQENCYNHSGDNAYTIFIQPDLKFLLCETLGSVRKPFTKSRKFKK